MARPKRHRPVKSGSQPQPQLIDNSSSGPDATMAAPVGDHVVNSTRPVKNQRESLAQADQPENSSSTGGASHAVAASQNKARFRKKRPARKANNGTAIHPHGFGTMPPAFPMPLGPPPSSLGPPPPAAPFSMKPAPRELFPDLVARRQAAAAAAAAQSSTDAAAPEQSNDQPLEDQSAHKSGFSKVPPPQSATATGTARKSGFSEAPPVNPPTENTRKPSIPNPPPADESTETTHDRETARKTPGSPPACIWKKVGDKDYIRVKPGEEHNTPGEILTGPSCSSKKMMKKKRANKTQKQLRYEPFVPPELVKISELPVQEDEALREQVRAYNKEIDAYYDEVDAFFDEAKVVFDTVKAWEGTSDRVTSLRNGLMEAQEKLREKVTMNVIVNFPDEGELFHEVSRGDEVPRACAGF